MIKIMYFFQGHTPNFFGQKHIFQLLGKFNQNLFAKFAYTEQQELYCKSNDKKH